MRKQNGFITIGAFPDEYACEKEILYRLLDKKVAIASSLFRQIAISHGAEISSKNIVAFAKVVSYLERFGYVECNRKGMFTYINITRKGMIKAALFAAKATTPVVRMQDSSNPNTYAQNPGKKLYVSDIASYEERCRVVRLSLEIAKIEDIRETRRLARMNSQDKERDKEQLAAIYKKMATTCAHIQLICNCESIDKEAGAEIRDLVKKASSLEFELSNILVH